MNVPFKLFVPLLGALVLLTTGIVVYRSQQASPPVAQSYQAAALDILQSAAPVAEDVVESPAPVVTPEPPAPVARVVAVAPVSVVPLPTPVALPATPAPIVESLPTPPSPPVPIIATTPVGVGGTLANRPPQPVVDSAPASEPVVTEPTATTTSETASSTEDQVVVEAASSTPPVEAATSSPAFGSVRDLVISEIFVDMVGADTGEFVELFNTSALPVALGSSSLQYLSASAGSVASAVKKNFPADDTIAASGFYLVGTGSYAASTTPDLLWSQSLNNTGATILLVADQTLVTAIDDAAIIDRIAYGSGTLFLAPDPPVPLPSVGSSLQRINQTGSFLEQLLPTPTNASST